MTIPHTVLHHVGHWVWHTFGVYGAVAGIIGYGLAAPTCEHESSRSLRDCHSTLFGHQTGFFAWEGVGYIVALVFAVLGGPIAKAIVEKVRQK